MQILQVRKLVIKGKVIKEKVGWYINSYGRKEFVYECKSWKDTESILEKYWQDEKVVTEWD